MPEGKGVIVSFRHRDGVEPATFISRGKDGSESRSPTTLLACWKDIATDMGTGVRTVQRWEQQAGLPVGQTNVPGSEESGSA